MNRTRDDDVDYTFARATSVKRFKQEECMNLNTAFICDEDQVANVSITEDEFKNQVDGIQDFVFGEIDINFK